MPLMGGDSFSYLAAAYRIVWLKGRFGGGKTALAYKLALDLCANHGFRYVVSNIDDVISDKLEDVKWSENSTLDLIIILDEGGLFLKYGMQAEQFLTLLRKFNVVVLLPSVLPPASRIRFFSVQRIMNLGVVGIPAWVYQYEVNYGSQKDKEKFIWWYPREIFGVYDTKAPPIDDRGISKWIAEKKNEFRGQLGYKQEDTGWESPFMDEGQSLLVNDAVEELADVIGEFSGGIETLSRQRHKRGRAPF